MKNRPWWWTAIHPDLTIQLLLIVIYLTVATIGNFLGLYESIKNQDSTSLYSSIISILLGIIPAWGLFNLRSWGRYLELGISGLIVIFFGPVIAFFENIFVGLGLMIIHGLIVSYLISAKCQKLFVKNNSPA